MLKSLTIFLSLLCMAYIAGCSSTPPTFTTPSTLAPPPAAPTSRTVLGGAIQGVGPLVLTNTVTIFAGGSAGFSNISTSAGRNTFNRPIAITTDGTNLYVADYLNNAIRQIVIASGVVTTIAGNGAFDTNGVAVGLNQPSAITTDGTNLYFADSGSFTVRKMDLNTRVVTTLAGGVGLQGSIDEIGLNARFNPLNGITTDGTYLYVTDTNNTVRRIVISSGAVTTFAGTVATTGSTDGIQTAARFNQPGHITTDGPSLYVTDWGNSTIRKIDLATGAVTTIAGNVRPGGQEGLSTDGTGSTASFNQPNGITTDGANLYVTESYGYVSKIRKIAINTGVVTTIAGGVVPNPNNPSVPADHSGSADGTGAAASFNVPISITTDGISLYIADELNHRIRKIN